MAIKHNEEFAQLLVSTLRTILDITGGVYTALDMILPKTMGNDFNRDMFTLCTVAVDNGLVDLVSGLLVLTMTSTPSKLNLGADGSVLIEGQALASSLTLEDRSVLGPTPALTFVSAIGKSLVLISPLSTVAKDVLKFVDTIQKDNEPNKPEEL
jgi:hypothetical protein